MSLDFKICKAKDCGQEFNSVFSKHRDYCSSECYKASKKSDLKLKGFKPIPNVSKKRQAENLQYQVLRKEFLEKPENRICPITGQPTTEIHHKRKRRGYADNWARDNKISLYLDTRFWLAVSRDGHQWIEDNPEQAYELGYSIRNNQK